MNKYNQIKTINISSNILRKNKYICIKKIHFHFSLYINTLLCSMTLH